MALRRFTGVALGGEGGVPPLLGGFAAFLHRSKRLVALGGGSIDRLLERRQLIGQLRETVRSKQPFGGCGAGTFGDEPIPASHHFHRA